MTELGLRRSPEALPQSAPQEAATERIELAAREKTPTPTSAAETTPSPTAAPAAPLKTPALRSTPPLQRSVEEVLEDGLDELYRELSANEQATFRAKGEVVAVKLTELIQKVTVKVSEIMKLIRDWLMTIPGINRYYLEQAAKIKADKILKLR